MLDRQFSLLAVIALLLSANVADANGLDGNKDLSVGNVKIQTTANGTRIQTPGVQIDNGRVAISRSRRRTRTNVRRTTKPSIPLIFNKKINTNSQTTVTTTTSPGRSSTIRTTTTTAPGNTTIMRTTNSGDSSTVINNSTIDRSSRNSTVRSTRIRSSSDDGDNVSEQEQSTTTSCSSGSGSSVMQSSSTTINGRTVSSKSQSNCN